MVENISNGVDDINLTAMISECNMVGNPKEWWIDTGATRHICANRSMFSSYTTVGGDEKLYMGNSSTSKVEGVRKIALKMTSGKTVTLINVLHVPDVCKNLVSGSLLSKNGFKLVFVSDKFVLSKNEMYVGKGYLSDGLFKLNVMTVVTKDALNKVASSYVLESSNIWHARLGHVNYKSIKKLMNMGLLPKFVCPSEKCQVCVESKFSKPPFHSVDNRLSKPLDLIHTDICDMKLIPSRGGNKYFITFIDDCSRYCYVYLLSSKDKAVNAFKSYKAEVETQLNKKIKIIRSDRGGEYEFPFEEICTEFGIVHQMTAPYTPQSNGVAERKNRSLKETMNALLNSYGLSQNLWGEAVLTENFILNRVPHRKTQQTPYEKWKGRMPNLNYLKVWGCLAKVAVPKPKKVKVGPKAIDCVFIGYAQNSNAYRFLVQKSEIPDIHVDTIIESRDASFFENIFPYNIVYESIDNNKRSRDTISRSDPMEDEPRHSKRQRTSTSFGPDFLTYLLENEPRTFKEAVTSPEAPFWKEAINSEVESILSNHTWKLVDLPPGNKPLQCKWIFKRKMKADGDIDKYKARLVVKGYKQREGLDYFDTYSPVTRITSIRMLIAIVAGYKLEIHQMDVKTAFLNGDLEEEIYLEQPEGFIVPGQEQKVCRLIKSLYGLKQAPKQWHSKFDEVMLSNGFKINECDKCVYVKQTQNCFAILCLYVDDMLITGSDGETIKKIKCLLASKFEMKDMGVADVIVKIHKTPGGLALSQSHYIKTILGKCKNLDIVPVKTPIDVNLHLSKNTGENKA